MRRFAITPSVLVLSLAAGSPAGAEQRQLRAASAAASVESPAADDLVKEPKKPFFAVPEAAREVPR